MDCMFVFVLFNFHIFIIFLSFFLSYNKRKQQQKMRRLLMRYLNALFILKLIVK